MKLGYTMRLMLFVGMAAVTSSVCAQDREQDSVEHVTPLPDPSSEYNDQLPQDIGPKKDSIPISTNQLPARVIHALKSNSEYRGWEMGDFYYDNVNSLYKIFIHDNKRTRLYSLDPSGHPMRYQSRRNP